MNNKNRKSEWKGSFADLIREALGTACKGHPDYGRFRTYYIKPRYRTIFPPKTFAIVRRAIGAEGSRKQDFVFLINKDTVCFVRNLWFAFQFFPTLSEIEKFMTADSSEVRRKLFERRFKELQGIANEYASWMAVERSFASKLEGFIATKTDLLAVLDGATETAGPASAVPRTARSTAVADLIREVEERASYQAGNPEDACEKALYFYALGCPEIGQAIAREVLDENPDHAVALYANAVFLLEVGERHQYQAFIHDVMHPHDLTPIEAEEFYHADRHFEESLRAEEKAAQALLLMLKARQHWPKKFPIKRYELAPDMWLDKVDEWILRQAAARLAADPRNLAFSKKEDAHTARESLILIIPQILDLRGRSLFAASAADFLRRLVIVAAHVHADRGRDCVTSLEAALASQKPVRYRWHSEYYAMDLPASCDPTFAATLIPAATDPRFCQAIFALKPEAEAVGLLSRIIETGIRDERDRVATIWTLKTKDVVLNIARGTGLAEAVRICLEMARRHDWPDTEAGRKLQCCWLYGAIRLLFESSRTAFEASDLEVAVKQAVRAIQLAVDSLPQIAHDNPLFKCYVEDEDGVFESMGDFFHRQPNIVTDANSSDYFPIPLNSFPFPGRENECWHDFAKWSDAGHAAGKPVLLAYGLWLSAEHGQGAALLPICEALAATLGTLKKPGD